MTPRENTLALFDKRRAERVGVMDSIWSDTLKKWTTQGYPTQKVSKVVTEKTTEGGKEVEKQVAKEVDAPVPPADHFGFDLVGTGGGLDMMPLPGYSEVVAETDEWRITRNGAGAAFKYWKHKSGTPEHVDFRMTSRAVWERDYRPHLLSLDRQRMNIETTRQELQRRRAQGFWTQYGNLFIFENMRRSLGDICMYESVLLDPDWIHDYNRVYTDFFKAHYEVLFREAGVADSFWLYEDLGYNKGLFMSPKVLGELFFPYYREIVDFLHSFGMKVCLHSCGSTREALPMIVEAGFDGLHPMEVAAGNDVFEYAEKYGDKLVLFGGFDKRILETHDHSLIRREITRHIQGLKSRGARFFFASDHSISTNVDYQDFLYALCVYREQMIL